MLLTLIGKCPECRFTKGTAQILLPTVIIIVSASQARLNNYQKYWQIQVRNSHEILMETNESIWTLKARHLWWPIACRQSDCVQMYSKVPRSLIIKAFNSGNVFVKTWLMSQSFDLLICGLWRWSLCDHQRNIKASSSPHVQRRTGNRCQNAFKTSLGGRRRIGWFNLVYTKTMQKIRAGIVFRAARGGRADWRPPVEDTALIFTSCRHQ